MKKITLMLLLLVSTVFGAGLFAQTGKTPEERAQRMMRRMENQLGLTNDQKTTIAPIALQIAQEMAANEATKQTDKKGFKERKKAIVAKANSLILPHLTAEQQEKYKQLQEERKDNKEKPKTK